MTKDPEPACAVADGTPTVKSAGLDVVAAPLTRDELRVVAAAIRDVDGTVFSVPPPGRHHDVIRIMREQGRACPPLDCQGFVLNDGRFVMRKAAKLVAKRGGQLLPRASQLKELFSEDVW